MAKLPSLEDLLKDPTKSVKNLSQTQLVAALEQAKALLDSRKDRISHVPDNPIDFAAKYQIRVESGKPWVPAPHLRLISDWLSKAESGARKLLLVSMPPRHGKSEMISYVTPLWLLARDPSRKILFASYEAEFAASWGRRVREAVLEYPELGLDLDMSTTAAHRWRLTTGGGMQTAGAGGPLTGKGGNCLIIDDPIKNYEEASSETMRDNMWNWFQTTAFTRLEPGGFCIILATRWHEDDLIGRLDRNTQIAREQVSLGKDPEFPIWDILRIPALAEEDDPLGRPPGAPLWPERFTLIDLEQMKKGMTPYNWSALYQQNPTPEEGASVRRTWWKYYKAQPHDYDQMIQSWDLPFKDLTTSDYAVGQVWGRKGAQFFLVDQVRGHMSIIEVIAAIRALTKKYPKATAKLIEDAANGPALIQTLQHEVTGMIPIKPKGKKDARLQAVVPLIQAGNCYLPQLVQDKADRSTIRWVNEFIDECAAFPNGQHDDQLDAMVHALTFMLPKGWQVDRQAEKAYESGTPPVNPLEAMTTAFHKHYKKRLKKGDRTFNQRRERPQLTYGPRIPW